MSDTTIEIETVTCCPTCGSEVDIHSSDEGTQSYVPKKKKPDGKKYCCGRYIRSSGDRKHHNERYHK